MTAFAALVAGFCQPDAHRAPVAQAPHDWESWLGALFPTYVRAGFAPRHVRFWEWVWDIETDNDPRPFVGIWPRGGAKSSSAELGVAALGLRGRRRYVLYVRDTQERADDSVGNNIAALFESPTVSTYYPAHAERMVGKYGNAKGWRRSRLRTAGGFTVDALGLDVASRGVKLEDQRPDVIVFDDIDARHDTADATRKKIATITESILPAGRMDGKTAVIFIQNLIIPNGIAARLADGRADFLAQRVVSGPEPALRGMKTEPRQDPETGRIRNIIVAGEPSWRGQDAAACQRFIDKYGLTSFKRECQHDVHEREGALWKAAMIARRDTAPPLRRVVVGVDPSGGGDEIGIIAGGVGYDGRAYVLADRSQLGKLGPLNWGRATVGAYDDLNADRIVAERNFGGDLVEANIDVAAGARRVPVKMVTASRGKAVRAEPVASLYEDGLVDHVGTFPELEAEMTGWAPGDPQSPNRLDALVWLLTELMLDPTPVLEEPEPSTSYSAWG